MTSWGATAEDDVLLPEWPRKLDVRAWIRAERLMLPHCGQDRASSRAFVDPLPKL